MSGRRRTKNRSVHGFTLIEVLVALVLITISIVSLIGLLSAGMKADTSSNYNSEATVIAKGIMEQMLDYQDFNSVDTVYKDATSVRHIVSYNGDTTIYKSNYSVATSPPPLGRYLKKYIVTVYWNRPDATSSNPSEASVVLVTLRQM